MEQTLLLVAGMKHRIPTGLSFCPSRPEKVVIAILVLFTGLSLPLMSHWENVKGSRSHGSYEHKVWPLSFQKYTLKNATMMKQQQDTNAPLSDSDSLLSPPPSLHQQQQSLTEPWDIVDQYIAWHSKEALRNDPHHRDYALSFYSCPLQAGNRLHHFLNSFLWSILTNRTMLWQYWDQETCQIYGKHYDSRICNFANQVNGCDPYLKREPWMTSYKKWTLDHPALSDAMQVKQLSFWATHAPFSKAGRRFRSYENSTKVVQQELGMDARPGQYPLVVFPQMLGQTGTLLALNETVRNHLLHTEWARQTMQMLSKYGADLLYGLLFYSAFSLTPQLIGNSTAMIVPNPHLVPPLKKRKDTTHATSVEVSTTCSVAIHSRHANTSIKGENVAEETACIQSLWQQHLAANNNNNGDNNNYSREEGCDVYVMSDRPHTLLSLIGWCKNYNPASQNATTAFPCRRVIHAMHERGLSFVPEHGPYAGVGFLQDLVVVRESALSSIGIVGGQRSSTDLLTEWMEYERLVDFYFSKDEKVVRNDSNATNYSNNPTRLITRPIPELRRCIMSSTYETGRSG
jgi:hypothetical protein